MDKRKTSFAVMFTGVCLAIMVCTTFALSFVVFINIRRIVYRQAEKNISESTLRLQEKVSTILDDHSLLLNQSAAAVVSLLNMGGGLGDNGTQEEMRAFFTRALKPLPNASYIYYTTNVKWDQPGGYFIMQNGWLPTSEYDQTKRSWFVKAKEKKGAVTCTDPYIDFQTNDINITFSLAVIYEREGKEEDLGVLGLDVFVNDLDSTITNALTMPGQEMFLLNHAGLFINHSDINAVMTKNFFAERGLERYERAVLGSPSFTAVDREVSIHSVSIPNTDWVLVSTVPVKSVFAEVDAVIARLVAIGLGLLGVSAALSVLFTHRMLTIPLREIERVAQSIAKMDFVVDIQKFRSDEIGTIQWALIRIRDSLRRAIKELNDHLLKMTDTGKHLNSVIVESSDALGVITDNMDAMQNETDVQFESVSQTSDEVEEIIKSIDELDDAVTVQASHIDESATAIEQRVDHIESIRATAGAVVQTTKALGASSAAGHTLLLRLAEEVQRMHEQSAALQSANKTISDIAGQTNILAMNAAIEAAHAGESGKGFAVVAQEIRKLAELAGKESDGVSGEIKKLEQVIERIGEVSKETVAAMDTIFTDIKSLDSSFTHVNRSVEDLAAGSSQILAALKTIRDITGQVRDGTRMIHRRSDAIHEEMEKLRRTSAEITSHAHEVKAANGNIATFLEQAKTISVR
jgi:methyl-accepting chemotaxis protein